jgi:hypothetical protein
MSVIPPWSWLDPSIQIEVERVSTDPNTYKETEVKIEGQESKSPDGVCTIQYPVSKKDQKIKVKLLNRNTSSAAKIRVVFVSALSQEKLVNSPGLGDESGIVTLEHCFRTQNGFKRINWVIDVPPTRDTIRIYDQNSKLKYELLFHNSD